MVGIDRNVRFVQILMVLIFMEIKVVH